jgi:hypothetical protein
MSETIEEIIARGRVMLEKLEEIERQQKESRDLVVLLKRQASLMLEGIDPQQVKSYAYDPLVDNRPLRYRVIHIEVYNQVTLLDGTRIVLENPIQRW